MPLQRPIEPTDHTEPPCVYCDQPIDGEIQYVAGFPIHAHCHELYGRDLDLMERAAADEAYVNENQSYSDAARDGRFE